MNVFERLAERAGLRERVPSLRELEREFAGIEVVELLTFAEVARTGEFGKPHFDINREGVITLCTPSYKGEERNWEAYLVQGEKVVPLGWVAFAYGGEEVKPGEPLRFWLPPLREGTAQIYYKVGPVNLKDKPYPGGKWVYEFEVSRQG